MLPVRQTIFVASHPKGRGNCMSACLASLLEIPLHKAIDTTTDECWVDWRGSIARWLADRGFKMIQVPPGDARLAGAYTIGCGPSPRGPFHHAVICKSGRLVFDPHPSDDGVIAIEWHELLVELNEAEMALHAAGRWYRRRAERIAA